MAATDNVELLRELCDLIGVSGYEDSVRAAIEQRIDGLVDDFRVDFLGNLIARLNCGDESAPTLMLDAHMDEIGLVISYIEHAGFLRFALVGGWDERVLPAQAVTVVTRSGSRIRGVTGVAPPHIQKEEDRRKPYSVDSLFIDVGARTREEAEDWGIAVGDSAVPWCAFEEMSGGSVMGKALDNRAGCALQIRLLEELQAIRSDFKVNIAAVFSTFEEIGARGAKAAAFGVDPQLCLIFEGTVAGDFPGISAPKCPSAQGRGAAISIIDRSTHYSPKVVRLLEEIAARNEIPVQIKTPIFGGTDGARIHMSRAGVLTGVLSVPCRYIHSAHATLRMEDFESTLQLALAFVRECRVLVP